MKDTLDLLLKLSKEFNLKIDQFDEEILMVETLLKKSIFAGEFLHFQCDSETKERAEEIYSRVYTYNTRVESSKAEYYVISPDAFKTLLLDERVFNQT